MAKAILGDYVAVCGGDLSCGVLLQRMSHLMLNAKTVQDGHLWYIATRNELMQATGLTKYKYDQAIASLRQMEFVETIHTTSMKNNSFRNTGFRVTEKAKVALTTKKSGDLLPAPSGDLLPDSQATYCPTYQATKKKSCYLSGYESGYSGEASSTAKKNSVPVEKAFREGLQIRKPDHFHVAWPARLKLTAKQFGEKIGWDKVENVTRVCVVDWSDFVAYAKKSSKLSFPVEPNMVSLAMHAEAAVNFVKDRAEQGMSTTNLKQLSELG